MQKHLNTLVSRAAGIALFLVGCLMAGLGLSVVFTLALFALAVAGLALLAAPLLALVQPKASDETSEAVA